MRALLIAGVLTSLLATSVACGDVLLLRSGGQIEGQLLNPRESPRKFFLVETSGGRIAIPAAQVVSCTAESPVEVRYQKLREGASDTAEGNWELAQWCEKNGLPVERAYHLEEVLRRNPDHEQARAALGYSRRGDRWWRAADQKQQQGYQLDGGVWRLPQDVEVRKVEQAAAEGDRQWRQKIKLWRTWLGKRRDQEARDAIKEIRDPLAVPALVELLRDAPNAEIQLLVVKVLDRIGTPPATAALRERVLEDATSSVRAASLSALASRREKSVVRGFIAELQSPEASNQKLNRAADALGQFHDAEAIAPLIEALVTKHAAPPPARQEGRFVLDMNNGGGLNIGLAPKSPPLKEVKNTAVLTALVTLTQGKANFGYDREAWRAWLAAREAPLCVNLRRDR